jgi:hypothetical protein
MPVSAGITLIFLSFPANHDPHTAPALLFRDESARYTMKRWIFP